MDSVRIEWNAEHDVYQIHVPGQKDIVVTIQELEDLKERIETTFKEVSA